MSNNKAPANAIKSKKKINLNTQFIAGLVALALILLFNLIYEPGFFRISIVEGKLYGSIIDIINRCVPTMIISMGMTLVIATGGVDISFCAVAAISGALAVSLIGYNFDSATGVTTTNMSMYLAILIALIVSTACGAWNGLLVSRLGIQPMVATLILMTAGRGIAQLITAGQITYIRVDSFKMAGGYIGKCPIPTPIFFAVITVVIVALILKKTALGLYIESVGINGKAARLVGLNSTMIKFLTYVICGVLAGIAGIVASSRIYSADANNIGLNLEMDAILAVALGGNFLGGGKFSLVGSVIGAYTIQALTTTLYAMNVKADQLPVYKAIVVIIIVTLQSEVFKKFIAGLKSRKASGAVAEGGQK